jgi:hypothetical protein
MKAAVLLTDHATVAEIDEALGYARRVPTTERGPGWYAFVDRLLEMRAARSTGTTFAPIFVDGYTPK